MKNLFIQPAAGDAGGAVGAALYVYHTLHKRTKRWKWRDCFLGPEYSDSVVEKLLKTQKVKYQKLERHELVKKTAKLIEGQSVVGWFQGRMEYGPRALGNRSILADARNKENQKRVNLAIKFRESFRPFAPVVMEDRASEWFDATWADPYMITVCQVKRKDIPAVTHVNNSARIQTVNKQQNSLYYDVIKEFYNLTGVGVLINTSFNQRGEPIVNTPKDGFMSFLRTDMDYLVIGSFLLDKKAMPARLIKKSREAEFEAD